MEQDKAESKTVTEELAKKLVALMRNVRGQKVLRTVKTHLGSVILKIRSRIRKRTPVKVD